MPRPAVRRSGSRIAGLSWLMLSRPENASHAPAKPTRNVVGVNVDAERQMVDDQRPSPADRCASR